MGVIYPPKEVFEIDPSGQPQTTFERIAPIGTGIHGWVKTVCPPEGGMLMYDSGLLEPIKGHPYVEAIESNNFVKRVTLMLLMPLGSKEMVLPALGFVLLPWKWKIRLFENWFSHYFRLVNLIYRTPTCHFLKPQFYNNFSQELWKFIQNLLLELGVNEDTAYQAGKTLATIFQYDDVYRYQGEDVASTTTKEKLLKNPRSEIAKIIQLFAERNQVEGGQLVAGRFIAVLKIASFLLWLPKIRKAFNTALSKADFTQFQLDKIDYYHILGRRDYKFLGRSHEDRMEERRKMEVLSQIMIPN